MKLHIDTDIGGNIDDLCALALALALPDVQLAGITTTAEYGGRRAGYLNYALAVAGRANVDVRPGADVASGRYRHEPRLLDEHRYWPVPIAPVTAPLQEALDLIQKSIAEGAVIAALGPLTNLALLEQRSPGTLRDARLFVMGGYVFPPPAVLPHFDHRRDTNLQLDVAAAALVLHAARPTLVPISVTVDARLTRTQLPALSTANPLAHLIARQAEEFARERTGYAAFGGDVVALLHDPLTCAIALGWRDGVEISELRLGLDIVDGWLHQTVAEHGRPTRIVTRVDGARFTDFWVRTVAS